MTFPPKAIFCWSSGKDSAYCLHEVLQKKLFDVRYLLTTLNQTHQRVSMHGSREDLVERQAAAIGIPLLKVWVSEGTNAEYERQMATTLLAAKAEGIEQVIFGDIFLEDLREYREKKLAEVGMQAVFPLWKRDTATLVRDFVAQGFQAALCCTNDAYLDEEWAGRMIDASFVNDLPDGMDPCGENGEYHTFCFGGPVFKQDIPVTLGTKVYKPLETVFGQEDSHFSSACKTKGFWYCDVQLVGK
jgi:uncharacterized protein (TIGR00290 family)